MKRKRSVWRREIRQLQKKRREDKGRFEVKDRKSGKDKEREAEAETKRGRKKDRDKERQKEREMIRFLSPLYGSGRELPFQSNQAQAKVNNQS